MSNLINKLLTKNFNLEEAKIFEFLTCHFQNGKATTQVPLIRIGFDEIISSQIDFKKLFDNNYAVWSTNQGVIYTEECRNPDNKRLISGYLFMSAEYLEKHLDLMYDVFSENNKRETTVNNKKDFLALIVTKIIHQKAPKGKEKISDKYLQLCEKLYPGEDIVNDRIDKYCAGSRKIRLK